MAKKVKKKKKSLKHKWKLEVKYVSVKKMKKWKKNPRKNDEAADKLCGMFEQYGFVVPIIATPDGIIRAGHTRFKAAIQSGYKTVPVIYVPFESRREAEMFAIADNKSSEFAEWDREKLAALFKKKKGVDVDSLQRMTGFQKVEIEGIRNEFGLPDVPPGMDGDLMPEQLEDSEIEGLDESLGRVIIVFYDEKEKRKLQKMLGIKFNAPDARQRVVWKVADLKPERKVKKVKRRGK